jgi:hypothetical protein
MYTRIEYRTHTQEYTRIQDTYTRIYKNTGHIHKNIQEYRNKNTGHIHRPVFLCIFVCMCPVFLYPYTVYVSCILVFLYILVYVSCILCMLCMCPVLSAIIYILYSCISLCMCPVFLYPYVCPVLSAIKARYLVIFDHFYMVFKPQFK